MNELKKLNNASGEQIGKSSTELPPCLGYFGHLMFYPVNSTNSPKINPDLSSVPRKNSNTNSNRTTEKLLDPTTSNYQSTSSIDPSREPPQPTQLNNASTLPSKCIGEKTGPTLIKNA